jgi:predicted HTH domain antitoxin
MNRHLSIDYPDTLPDVLQESREEFEQEARMAMAAKLFELKRIPSGTAAALVGMDRVSFLLRLHEFGVPMIDLDEAELAEDVAHA